MLFVFNAKPYHEYTKTSWKWNITIEYTNLRLYQKLLYQFCLQDNTEKVSNILSISCRAIVFKTSGQTHNPRQNVSYYAYKHTLHYNYLMNWCHNANPSKWQSKAKWNIHILVSSVKLYRWRSGDLLHLWIWRSAWLFVIVRWQSPHNHLSTYT